MAGHQRRPCVSNGRSEGQVEHQMIELERLYLELSDLVQYYSEDYHRLNIQTATVLKPINKLSLQNGTLQTVKYRSAL